MGSKINIINTSGKRLQKKPGINQTNLSSDGQSIEIQSPLFDGNAGEGGTPGGNNTEIQFNDGGIFSGSTGFTFDKTNISINLGEANYIGNSFGSNIIGGANPATGSGYGSTNTGHTIDDSIASNIFGGGYIIPGTFGPYSYNIPNKILSGASSTIIGGVGNFVSTSISSSIIGGAANTLCDTVSVSSIIGGAANTLCNNTSVSSIIGGDNNIVSDSSHASIIGGQCHTLSIIERGSIIGGQYNSLLNNSDLSSIIGGGDNTLSDNSTASSIIGGQCNTLSASTRSAIIGGQNLSLFNEDDTIFVPKLKVDDTITVKSGSTFSNGITGEYTFGTSNVTIVNGVIVSVTP